MHIAIEGLDGVGKTSAAKLLARQTGYVYQENPIYRLAGHEGANCFLKALRDVDGNLHSDLAAFFYGAGNLYLDHLRGFDNIVTDRHLCSTYVWNKTEANDDIFKALIRHCRKPDLTVILYADAEIRRKRIIERNSKDADLWDADTFDDGRYQKALSFVKEFDMNYFWLDNSSLSIQESVDTIRQVVEERFPHGVQ